MTLSRWRRDYLYIPLGGNRGSRLFTYRNLMLTMLLGGLWHGAGWTLVAWGAIHGTALVTERWRRERARLGGAALDPVAARLASLRDVPSRLLRVDLLPGGLVRRRLGRDRTALHRVGRAEPARHRRRPGGDRRRHRVAVPAPPLPADDHGPLLPPPRPRAGGRPLAGPPRHPRYGAGGRRPVHLLPVLTMATDANTRRRRPRQRVSEGGRRLHSAG